MALLPHVSLVDCVCSIRSRRIRHGSTVLKGLPWAPQIRRTAAFLIGGRFLVLNAKTANQKLCSLHQPDGADCTGIYRSTTLVSSLFSVGPICQNAGMMILASLQRQAQRFL